MFSICLVASAVFSNPIDPFCLPSFDLSPEDLHTYFIHEGEFEINCESFYQMGGRSQE